MILGKSNQPDGQSFRSINNVGDRSTFTRFSPKNHLVLSNGLALYEHVQRFAVLIECEAVLK
ncbi:hypothetical protein [Vacuolonema iberomarrocanum]|uniref:hypothetical protein n=1 Tax=Vacuolonema iberomarrocanum TaxID=3454632 RepID=UPI0019D945BB|nr:hypothetical protein [filamentous cyanobacterium LEGE 07170]